MMHKPIADSAVSSPNNFPERAIFLFRKLGGNRKLHVATIRKYRRVEIRSGPC